MTTPTARNALAVGWAVAVVMAWVSAGVAPLRDTLSGVRQPADFARDYVTARARIEDGRGAPPPEGEAGNARAVRYGAPVVALLGAYYHAHPPPARLPVRPLGLLPWPAAAGVWAVGSLLALGWLAISLLALWGHDAPGGARVGGAFVLLLLWPPVLHAFEKGQWSIWLAALLAAGMVDLGRGRQTRAGVLFGLAAALKLTPVVLLGLLVLQFRRAARAMVLTGAAAVAASLAIDGLAPWRAFLAGAARNAAVWAPWTANTASLAGVLARLFGPPGPFARPWIAFPGLPAALFDLTAMAFLAIAAWATVRGRRSSRAVAPPAAVALWLTLPVLLNPLGWTHVLVMLLAPLAVAVRDGAARTRALALGALVLFSIPRETLAALAGPTPVAPGRGLLLGVHAAGVVALFVALAVETRRTRAAD
ncbi:MAG TPA: glycosyltransferase family 87 protein [Polyangia bacterium]|nr:glycosyltransferase family 87 protein [Polyangia bacterium]